MRTHELKTIARHCREYASQYGCSLHDAIAEWEGNGPEGSFGLLATEQSEIANELSQVQGFDLDTAFERGAA